jgi:hypothetical protein
MAQQWLHDATKEARRMPPTNDFIIRSAQASDFKKSCDFYLAHKSPALPAPSAKIVGDTIADGKILIVEPAHGGALVASGAIFELSPKTAVAYVGELAGMRATREVGGLKPITMQMTLLGLRLLGHVAGSAIPARSGMTNSIIAIVKSDNQASIKNVEDIGMRRLLNRPDWFEYDEQLWNGAIIADDWNHYYADAGTIERALSLLWPVGLPTGTIELQRVDKGSQQLEQFRFVLELPDIKVALREFENFRKTGAGIELLPPPLTLTFRA